MTGVNVSTVRQANAWLRKMGIGNRVTVVPKYYKTYGVVYKMYQAIETLPNGSRQVIYQAGDINCCLDGIYNLILSRR